MTSIRRALPEVFFPSGKVWLVFRPWEPQLDRLVTSRGQALGQKNKDRDSKLFPVFLYSNWLEY
ncbi:hypothetical protein A361_21800 [Cytobacillus oceanisediminis 2691]|uniref:Uncharacterized protein n=1 Tax=Cytobacillus oceanisediminis 2691 TaxID=1196031 RepID=A0A169FX63_9BACI|nr:hypothetical protein A361_21800 [Cytobacillus oceanisediminis 2691]